MSVGKKDSGDDTVGIEEDDPTPGPDPQRLSLPHEDWEDAVSEALEGERPADNEEEEEEGDDATA